MRSQVTPRAGTQIWELLAVDHRPRSHPRGERQDARPKTGRTQANVDAALPGNLHDMKSTTYEFALNSGRKDQTASDKPLSTHRMPNQQRMGSDRLSIRVRPSGDRNAIWAWQRPCLHASEECGVPQWDWQPPWLHSLLAQWRQHHIGRGRGLKGSHALRSSSEDCSALCRVG